MLMYIEDRNNLRLRIRNEGEGESKILKNNLHFLIFTKRDKRGINQK